MATVQQLSVYAQTAQMAYAVNLVSNENNAGQYDAVTDVSSAQATQFDATWNVLQQSVPVSNGFSAVLLQNRLTGEKVLAIRGTEGTVSDWWTDMANIAAAGDVTHMAQYQSLELFYQQLIATGQLTASEQIVVTGHSLGGFLAEAFTMRHWDEVSAAYTYNAPGFGGVSAELLSWLGVVDGSIAVTKITNAQMLDGISATAGLGIVLGSTQGIRFEPDATSDDSPWRFAA